MPGVVECVGEEDGLEGLFVFVVGGIAAGFAHAAISQSIRRDDGPTD